MVSVSYDPDAKALYVSLMDEEEKESKKKISKTVPLGNDRYLDVDETGKAVGLEILFSQDLPQEAVDAIINNRKAIELLTATTTTTTN
jgi:uncharacterized protein YuzE